MRIEHIAMYVNDLERAKDFFTKYFNATADAGYLNKTTGFRFYFLTFEDGARLEIMDKFGNLFPYLLAMVIGVVIKELAVQQIELGTIIKIPDFKGILENYSMFRVGFSKLSMFISALPHLSV